MLFLPLLLAGLQPVLAQQEELPPPAELNELGEDQAARLVELEKQIAANRSDLTRLDVRIGDAEGLTQQILEQRQYQLAFKTLEMAVEFAERVADAIKDRRDATAFETTAGGLMKELPQAALKMIGRMAGRLTVPDMGAAAGEQAQQDRLFFDGLNDQYRVLKASSAAIAVGERLGIDMAAERKIVRERLSDASENLSVLLQISLTEVAGLKDAVSALPTDAELAAQLAVASRRKQNVAALLQKAVGLLEKFEVNTARYRQQLLTVTGEVTTTGFDVEVIVGLLESWRKQTADYLAENASRFLFRLLVFFLIIFVFVKLSTLVQKVINRALGSAGVDLSELARRMIMTISRNVIIIAGVLVALAQVGISLGPVLAGLGIAGFIIGFALQDSLSNFASGMMILLYRPFDVGDTVEVAGVRGKVSHMSLVNTTILTFDNQSLIIPNNKIWQDVIKNLTDQGERRVDLEFGITYAEDIDRVEAVLREVMSRDDRILAEPEPQVRVGSFGESSVNILCRPWVKTDDYWDVLWDLNKNVKQAFDREGITIPFPQRDVHIFRDLAPDEDKNGAS